MHRQTLSRQGSRQTGMFEGFHGLGHKMHPPGTTSSRGEVPLMRASATLTGRSTVHRLRSAGSDRPIGWNFRSAPSAGGGDRPIGCGRPDCRLLDGRSAVADPKKSLSQKRSRRNSVQNAPIEKFTALLGTTFVNISVFMSRANFWATFGPIGSIGSKSIGSIGSIGWAAAAWEKPIGPIGSIGRSADRPADGLQSGQF